MGGLACKAKFRRKILHYINHITRFIKLTASSDYLVNLDRLLEFAIVTINSVIILNWIVNPYSLYYKTVM